MTDYFTRRCSEMIKKLEQKETIDNNISFFQPVS